MDVGGRITELRKKKGITTNRLAYLAGISQSYLRDIELGKKNPTVEVLSYICEALDITLSDFFTKPGKYAVSKGVHEAVSMLSEPQQNKLVEFIIAVCGDKE